MNVPRLDAVESRRGRPRPLDRAGIAVAWCLVPANDDAPGMPNLVIELGEKFGSLMVEDTFQEEREAAAECVRTQLTSAQLSTDFVGTQALFDLRRDVRRAWGDDFNLKRYPRYAPLVRLASDQPAVHPGERVLVHT